MDTAELGQELKGDAKTLGDAARSRVFTEVDDRKHVAARQAKSAASALDAAADGLDDESPQWLRSAIQSGSRTLQRVADSVEGKSSSELMDDVQRMARNNPVSFLGICLFAGFAAVRVMKAANNGADQVSSRGWQSAQSAYGRQNGFGETTLPMAHDGLNEGFGAGHDEHGEDTSDLAGGAAGGNIAPNNQPGNQPGHKSGGERW